VTAVLVDSEAGDFMGFPAPSVGHHLRNPFDADLIYLMGGDRHGTIVAWADLGPLWK